MLAGADFTRSLLRGVAWRGVAWRSRTAAYRRSTPCSPRRWSCPGRALVVPWSCPGRASRPRSTGSTRRSSGAVRTAAFNSQGGLQRKPQIGSVKKKKRTRRQVKRTCTCSIELRFILRLQGVRLRFPCTLLPRPRVSLRPRRKVPVRLTLSLILPFLSLPFPSFPSPSLPFPHLPYPPRQSIMRDYYFDTI